MTQTYRFNDKYGEWNEHANSEGEAKIQAAATRLERESEFNDAEYGIYSKVGYGHWSKPPEPDDNLLWIEPTTRGTQRRIHSEAPDTDGALAPLISIIAILLIAIISALYGLYLIKVSAP